MNNLLAATTLDDSLQGIVTKLQSLMDSFWIYIVMALAAVVLWGFDELAGLVVNVIFELAG